MNLQNRIIKEYRSKYPHHTLREVSELTGIQLTRVFRILNGSAMKLEEYENFHTALHSMPINFYENSSLKRTVEFITRTFNQQQLNKITTYLERQVQWHNLAEDEKSYSQSDSILA